MEEDIDRIENLIFEMKMLGLNEETFKDAQALENIIKGYREERDLGIHYENRLDNMERLYVDKDKIKEKIEELKQHNYKGNLDDIDFINKITNELQELIEEE